MPEDTIILFIAELVLINVLIRSILNTKVLQGSVSTRLRCFYDQFITQSLLSPRVKKMKIGQHLPKLWAIMCRVVFYETRCIFSFERIFLKTDEKHRLLLHSVLRTVYIGKQFSTYNQMRVQLDRLNR